MFHVDFFSFIFIVSIILLVVKLLTYLFVLEINIVFGTLNINANALLISLTNPLKKDKPSECM